ncbi:10684_t:CDS:1 [Ambispora leptoticha]|uniref:10684_t:CDS:1 n=1 Tax=Ambispora leptoticha TaxID=144679 RepID=A0A9N9ADY9_9GLOM|nr:10684_t:CDS:1 [Ambispora leptoticha]
MLNNDQYNNTSLNEISQYNHLRPPFPPSITVSDVLESKRQNRQATKTMNCFFIYRKAMVMQNENQIEKVNMPTLSKLASIFWKEESREVKEAYKQLAKMVHDYLHQSISAIDFYQGASFEGYSQMEIPTHFSGEDIIYGIRDSFGHQNSSYYVLNQKNDTNETSNLSNLDALNRINVADSFSENNNYCDCGCLSCSYRIQYLEIMLKNYKKA